MCRFSPPPHPLRLRVYQQSPEMAKHSSYMPIGIPWKIATPPRPPHRKPKVKIDNVFKGATLPRPPAHRLSVARPSADAPCDAGNIPLTSHDEPTKSGDLKSTSACRDNQANSIECKILHPRIAFRRTIDDSKSCSPLLTWHARSAT